MTENELASIAVHKAICIHKALGPGLLESVYEACMTYELTKSGLLAERQQPIPLIYDEMKLDCGFRCDILVEKKLIVEVKAIEALNEINFAQILTHLRLTNIKLGLLMNFNEVKMKNGIRRVVNNL